MSFNWKVAGIIIMSLSLNACLFDFNSENTSLQNHVQEQKYEQIASSDRQRTATQQKVVHDDELSRVTRELELVTIDHIHMANKNLIPSKTHPKVEKLADGNVKITYLELDPKTIELSVTPNNAKPGEYMARIRYIESLYEGIGLTKEKVMQGPFVRLKSRRLTEIARYTNGKWNN